jgi:hypothetical protein
MNIQHRTSNIQPGTVGPHTKPPKATSKPPDSQGIGTLEPPYHPRSAEYLRAREKQILISCPNAPGPLPFHRLEKANSYE